MSLQSTDPIADLLTRIRNAALAGKNEVRVPSSKIKVTIADKLREHNYLYEVKTEDAKPRPFLIITIHGPNEPVRINEIHRISRPGKRVYVGADDIPSVKSGRGMVLVSTSQGVISGQEAVKARLGGELLLQIY